jgi:predicted nucleotide-binding protein
MPSAWNCEGLVAASVVSRAVARTSGVISVDTEPIVKKVDDLISAQLAALDTIRTDLPKRLRPWRDRTVQALSEYVIKTELDVLSRINTPSWEEDRRRFRAFLEDLRRNISSVPDYYLQPPEEEPPPQSPPEPRPRETAPRTVFVVHGHDHAAKQEVVKEIETMGLNSIVLHEKPSRGRTIIERFERHAREVEFAVVVLTPDDAGYPAGRPEMEMPRARQNAILELGYFCGALGRDKVCILLRGNLEIPSDYLGVTYTQMDEAGEWKRSLVKELKAAGFDINT